LQAIKNDNGNETKQVVCNMDINVEGMASRRNNWQMVCLLLMAVGTQMMVLPPLQAAATKKEITDSSITSAVEGGLNLEKGVFPNDVDISTS
jgi:hypothetical protein